MTKLKDVYPLYLNNEAVQPNTDLEVTDKYTNEVAFRTALATPDVIDEAIAGAVSATEPMAAMASYERQNVLQHCVDRFKERYDELAYSLCVEAGKPKCNRSISRRAPRAIWACGNACRSGRAASFPRSISRSISLPIKSLRRLPRAVRS